MKLHLKIVPIQTGGTSDGRKYYEQCLVYSKSDYSDYYPMGVVHIDTFWVKDGNNELYAKIIQGSTVFADADIVIDKVVG